MVTHRLLLRRRACPVLSIFTDPRRSAAERALFSDPRSTSVAWEGAGHWLHQERPDEFNELVDLWLAGLGWTARHTATATDLA